MAEAYPYVLRDARGHNESLLRYMILCISSGLQLGKIFGLELYLAEVFAVRRCTPMTLSSLVLVTIHWFQPERLCMSLAKNNLVSLMEWLGLTSCCNKNTPKWLEMYYHRSSGSSLAPCRVIAVMLIRNLHNIHTQRKGRRLINCIITRLAICHTKPVANSKGIGKILPSLWDENDINRNLEAQFVKLHEQKSILPFHPTPNMEGSFGEDFINSLGKWSCSCECIDKYPVKRSYSFHKPWSSSCLWSLFHAMWVQIHGRTGQSSPRPNKLWRLQFHSIRAKLSLAVWNDHLGCVGAGTSNWTSYFCHGRLEAKSS